MITSDMNTSSNILEQEWDLPPFGEIAISDYAPAIAHAIDEAGRHFEAIATDKAAPTFENTIEAMECADRHLQRISAILFNLNECHTSDAMQQLVLDVQPEITRLSTRVMTDMRLFRRVAEVKEAHLPLSAEKQTLLDDTYRSFLRHGVQLEGEARERFKHNQEELGELQLRFGQNALADMNEWQLHLTDEADLEGLPEAVRSAAADEARDRGVEGWVFTLAAPSYGPFMSYSARRDLRERMYRAYGSIGNRGNAHDNNAIIRRITLLRAEQARLLGYNTYCDYVLENRMVQSLPNLKHFMQELKAAVLPAAERDLADVAAQAESDDGLKQMMPWDFSYYAERLKQRRYHFDSEALRPYFALDRVREGIFGLYGRLYGLCFEEADEVPVYHPDVKVYRVLDGARTMGWLYLDMHPRASVWRGAAADTGGMQFQQAHGRQAVAVEVQRGGDIHARDGPRHAWHAE